MRVIKIIQNGNRISGKTEQTRFEDALKKQEPKKIIFIGMVSTLALWACPECGTAIVETNVNYCKDCGQKLKWGV